jgi:hypothetical protein
MEHYERPTPTSKHQLARDQNAVTKHAITIMPMHHPPHARTEIYAPASISQMPRLVRFEFPKLLIDPLYRFQSAALRTRAPLDFPQ